MHETSSRWKNRKLNFSGVKYSFFNDYLIQEDVIKSFRRHVSKNSKGFNVFIKKTWKKSSLRDPSRFAKEYLYENKLPRMRKNNRKSKYIRKNVSLLKEKAVTESSVPSFVIEVESGKSGQDSDQKILVRIQSKGSKRCQRRSFGLPGSPLVLSALPSSSLALSASSLLSLGLVRALRSLIWRPIETCSSSIERSMNSEENPKICHICHNCHNCYNNRFHTEVILSHVCIGEPITNNNVNSIVKLLIEISLLILHLSVVSVAKAHLCLRNPSIIISKVYRTDAPFSLGMSSKNFLELESGEKSLDMKLIPEKGTKSILINYSQNYSKMCEIQKFIVIKMGHLNVTKMDNLIKHFGHDKKSISTVRDEGKSRNLILLRSGDVERTPGPKELLLVSQNCRGLKNDEKLKQLLNSCHKLQSNGSKIIALQESHLENSMIKYMWLGNFALTPSQGSKGGVITLLSPNIVIHEQRDLSCEGHILLAEAIADGDSKMMIIVNLHAPCPHNNVKIKFFESIRDHITDLSQNHDDCNVIILGDYNTTFWQSERINTSRSKREIEIASKIDRLFEDLAFRDCWNEYESTMTWRHGEKMSRIDRIKWTPSILLEHKSTEADWSLTTSDHAAVIVKLVDRDVRFKRSKITRIDTSFLSNIELRRKFLIEIDERMSQIEDTTLSSHGKLEFLKVSIRSIAIEIATNHKKEMESEYNRIKLGLSFWQSTFENAISSNFKELARVNLDKLTTERNHYLNQRGKYLCTRSKSKWYQEGERSTKYFLNLNKARNNSNEMTELMIDNQIIKDKNSINGCVEDFYKKLYEKGNQKQKNNSSLESFLANLQTVTDGMRDMVDSDLTIDELYTTLKSCQDSAPGPDGIPYSLIKLTWKHFGRLLLDSWNYARLTGQLSFSHEQSYLRLLPKEGKDTRHLKNWRPITLSNCDFKLITKTLSWRLGKAIGDIISPNQTAYIKDRQISDNLHVMLHTIEKNSTDSMLVSLDAEKAFDSLEHWYIKEVLKRIGLNKFIDIFDLLYRDQSVDIVLNGEQTGKYKIKNGVKQGDALSCMLFILGVEPLLENINNDASIKSLQINSVNIPKAVAYADDVACLIYPDNESLQKIFNHYDNLTNVSGLKLNADKTEIITKGSNTEFRVTYQNQIVDINVCEQIKVNGIVMSYNYECARKNNIAKMLSQVELKLRSWSSRNLSLLGKIQIFKTFGLSQILYTLSVMDIKKLELKALTGIIYKFIWNRNMDAKKAPDRIKRKILEAKVNNLGFGMIDYREVVKSLRLKNLIRLLNNVNSPLSNIIKGSVSCSVLNIKLLIPVRDLIDSSIKIMNNIWKETMSKDEFRRNDRMSDMICNEFFGNVVQQKFKRQKLCRLHRNDTIAEVINLSYSHQLLRKIDPTIADYINLISPDFTPTKSEINYRFFPGKGRIHEWPKITSKLIRHTSDEYPIKPKLITTDDTSVLKGLGKNITTMTNVKLKSILLRCMHGDVYSRERMFRFGMTSDNLCSRCQQIETTEHMLIGCDYVLNLWTKIGRITGIPNRNLDEILGAHEIHDKITLTIHAEVLRRLLAIERPVSDVDDLLLSIVRYLNTLERGVTKYQVAKIVEYLEQT